MKILQIINKNYRKKYIYYFCMTFMIPIMVILMVNMISQNMVKNQIILSGNKTLTQFFSLMDKHMQDMIEDAYSIVQDDEVIGYAKLNVQDPRKYSYYHLLLKNKLYQYNGDADYGDILLWYAYDDRVISSQYPSQNIELYYRNSYDAYNNSYSYYSTVDMESFYEVIQEGEITPRFKRLGNEWDKQHLCLSLRQSNTNNIMYNFTLTIIVKQKWFDRLAVGQILEENENVLMFSDEGELLFSGKEDSLVFLPPEYRNSGVYEIEEDSGRYILLVQESSVIRGCYALKISKDIFWDSLTGIQIVSWVGIFGSIMVGLLITFRFSGKAYKPLEDVLEQLNKTKKEQDILYKKLGENESIKSKKFLLGILEGKVMEDTSEELFKKNGICFTSGNVFIGVLSLNGCGKIGWDMLPFVIENIFYELGSRYGQCYILSLSTVGYVIIVNLSDNNTVAEEIEQHFLIGITVLSQKMDISATLGCGKITEELLEIHDSYRQAQLALEYRFLMGNRIIISYRNIEERKFKYPFSGEHRMYQMASGFLKTASKKENAVEDFVNQLLKEYEINCEVSMETADCFKYDVLQMLNRVFMSSQITYFDRQTYISSLMEKEMLTEYCEVLKQIFEELLADSLSMNSRRNISNQIRTYVEDHFMDSSLNVACIGEIFGMQAAYLSKIFREEYEISLPDYIARARINKSKQLLKEGKLTIEEIAECTGFMNSNIYINNFKKWEAITPGKYRKLQENRDEMLL